MTNMSQRDIILEQKQLHRNQWHYVYSRWKSVKAEMYADFHLMMCLE